MAPTEDVSGPLERLEGGWITQEHLVLSEGGGVLPLHWPLTLQHRYSGLSTDPAGGRILVQVVTSRVIAGSALVCPNIVQREIWDTQHTHCIGTVGCADGHPPLSSAVPQLPEGISSVDLRVPPLDFWGGVAHYVTVKLKGVSCELSLRKRWFHKASWWCWWRFRGVSPEKENRWKM